MNIEVFTGLAIAVVITLIVISIVVQTLPSHRKFSSQTAYIGDVRNLQKDLAASVEAVARDQAQILKRLDDIERRLGSLEANFR